MSHKFEFVYYYYNIIIIIIIIIRNGREGLERKGEGPPVFAVTSLDKHDVR